ncbi:MAG TPA: hypothetical protein VGK14_04065 [Novimethylophilus sp.]|uniref:hypothetical protein n=1 Tax=Novimethylophilus sp. TaxID=2137426 RepID=UPI002F4094CC
MTQIVSVSALSRTAISHQLKVLRQAGALHSEKSARKCIPGSTNRTSPACCNVCWRMCRRKPSGYLPRQLLPSL